MASASPRKFLIQKALISEENPDPMQPQEQQVNNTETPSPSFSSPSRSNNIEKKKKKKKKNKKTRDLPNLTQCHSCGFRIDSCSGKNTIQTPYSEWRIVLLCETCFLRVESSTLCSYCFEEGSLDNCFRCPRCKRIVHKACFIDHVNIRPWSFSCAASQFFICLDCWIPKSIAAKRAYLNSKRKNSVALDFAKCRKKLLQDVVRDADCDAQMKVEAATRARELVLEKVLAARRAAQLARNSLDLVGNPDENAVSGVDEGELALRLNGVMDFSPRILKNFCSFSSRCLAVSYPLVGRKLEVSPIISVPDTSVPVRVSGYDSSMNLDSLGSNGIDDGFIRPNAKDCDVEVGPKEGLGSSSNKLVNSVSQSCGEGNGSMVPADESNDDGEHMRYLIKYTRRASADLLSDRKPHRYMIKYKRRAFEHETYDAKTDQYLIKYTKRTSAYERYKEKLDRFVFKYTRRKLNQRPILDSKTNCLFEALPLELRRQLLD